jgi:hypothetical protein
VALMPQLASIWSSISLWTPFTFMACGQYFEPLLMISRLTQLGSQRNPGKANSLPNSMEKEAMVCAQDTITP